MTANEFTFRADITFDHVLPSGQKVQYSATEDVAFQRPGGLFIAYSGDLGDRRFGYDGRSVTLCQSFDSGSSVIYQIVSNPA